jgi:hypothetical protein
MSNATYILDIMTDKKVTFSRVIIDAKPLGSDLGKPIAFAISPFKNE